MAWSSIVSDYERIRRQQVLLEAEGYLELSTACGDDLPLSTETRDQLAQNALSRLSTLSVRANRTEEALYLRGMALRTMERHREAIGALEQAAELNPCSTSTWLALGWCQKRVGRLDLAIQALEEALEVDPDEAIINYNLACYWSLANNPKLALRYLHQAFEQDASYRDLVAAEVDFDPIRSHPGFLELTSVIV